MPGTSLPLPLPRRALLAAALGGLALPTPHAQTPAPPRYPTRPIKVVVPFTTGASADLVLRTVSEPLSRRLGQPIVVENLPGAGTKIGHDAVARAQPDGHTLLFSSTLATATQSALTTGRAATTASDFTLVARVARLPLIVVARTGLPVKSLREFVAHLQAHPGKLSYASTGAGSPAHLMFALLEKDAGGSMTHVPYKGGSQVMTDLLGGHVDVSLLAVSTVREQVESGKLLGLALYAAQRSPLLPAVSTVAEQGFPPAALESAYGFIAPPGLAPAVLARLAGEIEQVMAEPAVQKGLAERGLEHEFVGPQAYRQQAVAEAERIAELVRGAQIRLN